MWDWEATLFNMAKVHFKTVKTFKSLLLYFAPHYYHCNQFSFTAIEEIYRKRLVNQKGVTQNEINRSTER